MNTLRLFVGIRFDSTAARLAGAVAERLRAQGLRGRYVDLDDVHVTLAFLGSVEERMVDELSAILVREAASAAPFVIRFDRLGAFPNKLEPRIVWLGSRRPSPAFEAFGSAVRAAYAAIGFTFRDELRLHATLCRPQLRSRIPDVSVEPFLLSAQTVCLIESTQGKPRYRTLYEARLGG